MTKNKQKKKTKKKGKKRVKYILFSFYLQNLQHSVQNNYIYVSRKTRSSGAKKLKEALQSLHDEYSEENLFAEATDSDDENACLPFHLLDIDEEADDIEV